MGIITYSKDDYLQALAGLMPTGRVWPKEQTSTLMQALMFIGIAYNKLGLRAANLVVDAFPSTTYELLVEWEKSLGLPDPCAGIEPTVQQRRNQVVSRFVNVGGQSIAYLTQFTQNLGFDIEITNCAPFRCGESSCGDSLGSDDWVFTFIISGTQNTLTYFECGQSGCGEPLRTWTNDTLECEIARIAPAHTLQIFDYS